MEADMQATAARAFGPWAASTANWPARRPDLAALKDLGLSDSQIADYFGVRQDEVRMLRMAYGISDHPGSLGGDPPRRRRVALRRRP
jgi:hypothetical protein